MLKYDYLTIYREEQKYLSLLLRQLPKGKLEYFHKQNGSLRHLRKPLQFVFVVATRHPHIARHITTP